MATQRQAMDLRRAVEAALADRERADRYQGSQRAARSGLDDDDSNAAHPLEYDESGFPVAQRVPGFVRRVARLLGPR